MSASAITRSNLSANGSFAAAELRPSPSEPESEVIMALAFLFEQLRSRNGLSPFHPLLLALGGREAGVEIAGERQVIAHQLGVLLAVRRAPVTHQLGANAAPRHRNRARLDHAPARGVFHQLVPSAGGIQYCIDLVALCESRERAEGNAHFR